MGFPRMNYEVIASPAARAISGKKSFRCDLCWPEARLDVEYQSKENHEGELSRIRDSRRANALAAMGWTVLGVTNDELNTLRLPMRWLKRFVVTSASACERTSPTGMPASCA